jgi:hypothetical protein
MFLKTLSSAYKSAGRYNPEEELEVSTAVRTSNPTLLTRCLIIRINWKRTAALFVH